MLSKLLIAYCHYGCAVQVCLVIKIKKKNAKICIGTLIDLIWSDSAISILMTSKGHTTVSAEFVCNGTGSINDDNSAFF